MRSVTKNHDYAPTVLPDGSWILFNAETASTVVVTPPAGIYWELCDGVRTQSAIFRTMCQLYPEQSSETIRTDIDRMTEQLADLGLLQVGTFLSVMEA
ncbi:PqqD family protein [Aromatoleum sp.]|uniref:PqqD family protein n=1 Tax=Aromatoleum sp. TaxID=2307007 RepID=UPI002FC7B84A